MAGSSTTTQWILELMDKVSAPMRGVDKNTKSVNQTLQRVTASLNTMDETTRTTANQAIKSFNELNQEIQQEETQIKKLKAHLASLGDAVDPLTRQQIDFDVKQAETKVRRYKEQLVEVQEELKDIENAPDQEKLKANWGAAVVVANQTVELVNKAIDGLRFTTEIESLKTNIERFSGASGDALDDLTAKAYKLGAVFKENPDEIAKAANAMTKLIGGTYEDNFALIEAGFEKGANINGDFIDQLKEYPTFINQLGLSQSQAIALMAKAGQEGIFSDKAIDSIKEADLSLREIGQPQIDALKGIGLEVSDLANKTSFEAVQMISKSMEGATTQAKQLVLADIFKGAGEDAGLAWIEGLGSIDLDINNIPSVQEAGSGIRGWLADLKTSFSATFGSIAASVVELSPVVTGIASAIPLISSLTKVTWLQDVATKAMTLSTKVLGITMMGTPIGWIVAGLAALTAGVMLAWDQFEGFREVIFKSRQILKLFGGVLKDYVINRIKDMVSGISGIGKTLMHFFNGEWSKAFETGKQAANDLLGLDSGKQAGAQFIDGWSGAMEKGQLVSDMYTANKNKAHTTSPGLGNFTSLLDGKTTSTGSSSGSGSGSASGLNGIGKGAGKTVTMNLDIKNYFNIDGNWRNDIDKIADAVTGKINDRLRDSLISL
ncbi:phage tail tape measure protein [Formosa sp. A9]|uniref:phage tail tape measure protein n=1 Tax=Formosa sp. A9 TaxID=3442641 RepID=UPI003EB7F375